LITRFVRPDLSPRMEAVCVATLVTLYDFLLEPFATQVKHYWVWESGSIPLQNYVAWWVLGFGVTWLCAPTHASSWRNDFRPWLLIGLTLLIFVAGRV
jgi:putative membrane protein